MWQTYAWSFQLCYLREAASIVKYEEAEKWLTYLAWHYGNSWVIPFYSLFLPLYGTMSHIWSLLADDFWVNRKFYFWMSRVVSPECCELPGHVHIVSDLDSLRGHWMFILKQNEIPLNLLFWSMIYDYLLDLSFFSLSLDSDKVLGFS